MRQCSAAAQVLGGGERDRLHLLRAPVLHARGAHEEERAFDSPSQTWHLRFLHGSGLCLKRAPLLLVGFFRVAQPQDSVTFCGKGTG
jgi:hypothetical protein